MNSKIGWGILSTGRIAHTFARSLRESETGYLAAVGSRSLKLAKVFARKHKTPNAHGSYESLLADPSVEAVYIATPHPAHVEWVVKTVKAGKSVLCEKPLTMNAVEAKKTIEAARQKKVFLMEAFAYRCHPQTAQLIKLIENKVIGEVRLIQSSFCFNASYDPKNRLFNRELGGGGILDVGCYPVSMARLIAGVAQGKAFEEPSVLKAAGHIGQSGVDEWAMALLKFPGNILADVTCGIRTQGEVILRIHGTLGSITVPEPFSCGIKAGKTCLLVHQKGKTKKVVVESDRGLYAREADALAQAVRRGKTQSLAMPWADSLGNMKTLDLWLKGIK